MTILTLLSLCMVATKAAAFVTDSKNIGQAQTDNTELFASTDGALQEYSKSLPFMIRPAALDGTFAGDVGFDPLGLAQDKKWLFNYREAEIKHARLAMLAAAGWPLSELWDEKIASTTGFPALVDVNGRAPSLLNGGLGKVSIWYWLAVTVFASAVDLYGLSRVNDEDYVPGDLGFDPLGLHGKKAPQWKRWMETAEIKNGRLAMLAITGFALQEVVTQDAVVHISAAFFQPLDITLDKLRN